jgi:hypothetical protein
VSKYEKEKALTISDSLERYFGDQQLDDKSFKMNLVNYAKQIGRNGLSILGDIGAYPTKYDDVALKGFCLYHQKHFDNFSDEQKQKLIEHHGKAIEIIKVQ